MRSKTTHLPTRVAVLSIHGIGTQNSSFADVLHSRIEKHLSKHGVSVQFDHVYWADELDGTEEALLSEVKRQGGRIGLLRRLAVETFSDAQIYAPGRPAYERVQARVVDGLDRLYAPWRQRTLDGTPLFILAHSFGGQILSDFLQSPWAREAKYGVNELRGIFTFGCNIPMVYQGRKYMAPPLRNAVWRNFWDADDFLGFPLAGMPELRGLVRDVKVDVGGWLTSWNGLCHMEYFNDRGFARTIANEMVNVLHSPSAALSDTVPDLSRLH